MSHRPGLISEREFCACAHKVIDSLSPAAEIHAAIRADELLAHGDMNGQRV